MDSTDELIAAWLHARVSPLSAWARRHPHRVDVLVAVAVAAVGILALALQGHRVDRALDVVFCLALPAPLLLRAVDRRLAFALVALVALAQWISSTPQLADGAVLVALFWIALDGELTEIALASAVAEAGAVMAALHWSPVAPLKALAGVSGLVVAAVALGVSIRQRRALDASMRERSARLELERDQQGLIATAAERARIAREMHDIVSHNLTVMTGLADGAGYALEANPDRARDAMRHASQTGRQALSEMRRLLGVLRSDEAGDAFAPQPGLDRLGELLDRVRAAGVPVALELSGDPGSLPSGVQLAVYRIAQEALTNTLRHAARPASATLALCCDGDGLELVVRDRSSSAPASRAVPPDGGRGLRGMHERAAAYGGRLDAGPHPDGGFEVRLTLALSSPAGRRA